MDQLSQVRDGTVHLASQLFILLRVEKPGLLVQVADSVKIGLCFIDLSRMKEY